MIRESEDAPSPESMPPKPSAGMKPLSSAAHHARRAAADRARREHLLLLELVAELVDLELVLLREAALLLQVEGAAVLEDLALGPARGRQALDLSQD
jgi:hypothetical protein